VERQNEQEVINEHGEREIQTVNDRVLDYDKYDRVMSLFERAFKDNQPPFQGDLENETYKGLLAKFKSFVP
jgi:hypothetical protein